MVVYQFTCAGCNPRYIGETSHQFATRVKEHLLTDKNCHVFGCCNPKCSVDCFKIVDSAKTKHCLKLKEAIYISHLKPESFLLPSGTGFRPTVFRVDGYITESPVVLILVERFGDNLGVPR